MRAASFPVIKTLDEFDGSVSSIPRATLDYLAPSSGSPQSENVCLLGPAGTGKSHCSSRLATPRSPPATGSATSPPPSSSRPSIGPGRQLRRQGIDHTLRTDLVLVDEIGFAAIDDAGERTVLPARRRRLRTRGRSGSALTGPSTNGASSSPNTRPPSASSTGSSTTPPLSSPTASPTACAKHDNKEVHARRSDEDVRIGRTLHPAGTIESLSGDRRSRFLNSARMGTSSWPKTGTATRPLTFGRRTRPPHRTKSVRLRSELGSRAVSESGLRVH